VWNEPHDREVELRRLREDFGAPIDVETEVPKDHVGTQAVEDPVEIYIGGGLADDLNPVAVLQPGEQRAPSERIVTRDQNPQITRPRHSALHD
jgi:hypothetical protein